MNFRYYVKMKNDKIATYYEAYRKNLVLQYIRQHEKAGYTVTFSNFKIPEEEIEQ